LFAKQPKKFEEILLNFTS